MTTLYIWRGPLWWSVSSYWVDKISFVRLSAHNRLGTHDTLSNEGVDRMCMRLSPIGPTASAAT